MEATRLTELRRQEQDLRGYAASSRWYIGLNYAIKYLERAEKETDPLNRFREAWSAIYNLFMMVHIPGDLENKTLLKWIQNIKDFPKIRTKVQEFSNNCLESILKAEKALLRDTQREQWRESKQHIETWLQKRHKGQELSSEKACTYTFLIGRDIRNAISHPDRLNPKARMVKPALQHVADFFVPLAVSAIESVIEQPLSETTGRMTAYRSFLYPFLKNSASFFSDYYLERLFPDDELEGFDDDNSKQQLKDFAKKLKPLELGLKTANLIQTQQDWCETVLFPLLGMTPQPGITLISEEGVFTPSYVIAQEGRSLEQEYQGKSAKNDISALIWVIPWSNSLDSIADTPEFNTLPMMEVVNRSLANSDVSWGILTNGQQIRLLSRSHSHQPRCFLEIDLWSIVDRKGDKEALLAFKYFLALFSQSAFTLLDDNDQSLLDRVVAGSERHGTEISEELKQNVFGALEEIGEGFVNYLRQHPDELALWGQKRYSSVLAQDLLTCESLLTEIYQESLGLMYRLLFLFYAESRDLLPMEQETYRDSYSLESLRDDIIATLDDPDPSQFFSQGEYNLWQRLRELFGLVNQGGLGNLIPAYNGGLFDSERHEFLEWFKIGDSYLAKAIDYLSRTQPSDKRPKGEGRKKVTYRDLDIRHLGSIYEGILEYAAHIADEELVILEQGKSGKKYEEYQAISELNEKQQQQVQQYCQAREENPDNPRLPRSCKVKGLKPQGSYFLVYGGKESKRKSSGSYYTPDYIVQYIVENTLTPLLKGENRGNQPLSSEEILNLKVLDPAMGSGHFLVAATEFLARAYGEALIREGKDEDGIMDEAEFIRYKRKVAERCIYGVDINPMAVELAKLSMWLFTMDQNRPLSFLNHHLKCGNSLIGAWIEDLSQLPEFDKKGKPKAKSSENKQLNVFFEQQFKAQVPTMIRDVFGIINQETETVKDIELKKDLDKAISEIKRPFKNIADLWVGTFFKGKADNYDLLLNNVSLARDYQSETAQQYQFFHWELEFPEVFFNEFGQDLDQAGFDAIIGNPPYLRIQGLQEYYQNQIDYFIFSYKSAVKRFDIYLLFIEKFYDILNQKGRLIYICPHKFTNSDFGSGIRKILIQNKALKSLISFGNNLIFENASIYTGILTLEGSFNDHFYYYEFPSLPESEIQKHLFNVSENKLAKCKFSMFSDSPWILTSSSIQEIISKIQRNRKTMNEVFKGIFQGIVTGIDEIYFLKKIDSTDESQDILQLFSEREQKIIEMERDIVKPILKGEDIFRYQQPSYQYYCIYPYQLTEEKTKILEEDMLFENYPLAYSYLSQYRDELYNLRIKYKTNPKYWYSCHRGRSILDFEHERIITPEISLGCNMFLDCQKTYHNTKVYSILLPSNRTENSSYWLGLLNSNLMWWFLINTGYVLRGGYFCFKTNYLKPFPVHQIDFSNPYEREKHDKIVSLVEQMLTLNQQLQSASNKQKETLQTQINETDQEIDRLVYELYGLTPEEIAIVEEAVK
jgi:type I restriction-modification system DNA methylase subunit